MEHKNTVKKAKGVKKCVVERNIRHEEHLNVLVKEQQMEHTACTIRTNLHKVGSYEIRKKSLSCFDDKRYILGDGETSLAYGHRRTK